MWPVSVSGGVKLECLIIKDMQEKAQLHKKVLHTQAVSSGPNQNNRIWTLAHDE